jgi:uncharacterized cysteine cluster protein YcgN (CxxCxxCC family)
MARPSAPADETDADPFWRRLSLAEMSERQWESLCDGCARCCLNKLIYEDTGELAWTDVACRLLDGDTCRCRDYEHRQEKVPDCVRLSATNVVTLGWLPPTCAYRLVAEGRDLYWWHPLVSGDPETVHEAGVSVKGRTVSEEGMSEADLDLHIVAWPGEGPPQKTRAKMRKAAGR